MEDEELQEKIEQLRANRGGRRAEYEGGRQESRAKRPAERQTAAGEREGLYEGYPFEEDEPEPKARREDGILGVFTYQSILAVTIAILYVLLMTLSPEISGAALSEVKERTLHDFSFRGQVYETVGNFLTYLNEIKPVDGTPGLPGSSAPEESAPEKDDALKTGGASPENPLPGNDTAESLPDSASPAPDPDPLFPSDAAGTALDGKGGEYNPVNGLELPANATFAPVIFTGRITFPIEGGGRISSGFGFREHPTSKADEFHTAVDIAAPKDTNVLAAADGIVTLSEESGALGRHIVLDHGNGFETIYGHCDRLIARVGTRIREGEVIAKVGSTGDSTGYHLHFGMRKNGLYFDPACVFPFAVEPAGDD